MLLALLLPGIAAAQDGPILSIDEDCTAFAFAPDGRIAYAVRHLMRVRRVEMQRDDIWVTTLDGKKKRIVNGERLVQGNAPFSYAIQSLRWSPDSARLTVEMYTSRWTDERGSTEEGQGTLLIDDDGKEIKIQGADSLIPGSSNGAWLNDGVTVAYLSEAVKPNLLFSIQTVRPVAGRGSILFDKHTFATVAWDVKHNAAVAVERDPQLSSPPRLVWLDLQKQTLRVLAELPGFLGDLVLSPSGNKVAYYTDNETIEARDIQQPEKVVRVHATFGTFIWKPDETAILLKRGTSKRSADLMWLRFPDGQLEPVLHSIVYRDFDISPDGRNIAVTLPGKRILQVWPLP